MSISDRLVLYIFVSKDYIFVSKDGKNAVYERRNGRKRIYFSPDLAFFLRK